MSIITTIVNVLCAVLCLALCGIGLLNGHRRGLLFSGIRAGVICVSFLLAMVLTNLLAPTLNGAITSLAEGILNDAGYLEQIPIEGATEIAAAIVGAMVIPFIYALIFIFLDLLAFTIFTGVTKRRAKNMPPEKKKAWFGALVSSLMGLAVTVFLLAPLAGTLDTVILAVESLQEGIVQEEENSSPVQPTEAELDTVPEWEAPQGEDPEDEMPEGETGGGMENLFAVIKELDEGCLFLRAINDSGGSLIYDNLAVVRVEGATAPLRREVTLTAKTVTAGMKLAKDLQLYGEEQTDAVREIAASAKDSVFLPVLEGRALAAIGKEAVRDHSVLDMPLPDFGPFATVFMDDYFAILADTDETLVEDDLFFLADLLDIFIEYDILLDIESHDETLRNVTQEGCVAGLKEIVTAHPRYHILLDEVYEVSLLAVASGVHLEELELNDPEILGEVADELNRLMQEGEISDSLEDMVNTMIENGGSDLADKGIDISGVTEIAAEAIIDYFEDHDTVTAEDLESMIEEYRNKLKDSGLDLG